jgi:hypothetical protein
MSQQEFFDLLALVNKHGELLRRFERDSRERSDTVMDYAQMKFILGLYPVGPMAGFLQALDTLDEDTLKRLVPLGPLDGFVTALEEARCG